MATISTPIYGGMFDSTSVEETVGGFPRGNKAVDSEFFAKIISCFYSDGIFGQDSFKVIPKGGLSVGVDYGVAWIRGYMAWQKTPVLLNLSSGATYYITLRLNIPAGEFTLCATSDSPLDTETVKDLVLAEVTVTPSTLTVTSDMINDTREDKNRCGFVTSTVDALGIVSLAENANMLGGISSSDYMRKSGGAMTGSLKAAADSSGMSVVRNISYGSEVPTSLAPGEIFIMLSGN